ncbi:MAG: ribonuclease D [Vicinamibacteria bacterium]
MSVATAPSSGSFELIESRTAFLALIEESRAEPVVGLDTEAASFHRYRDRVYLLQLSSPTRTAVVDPLAVGGLDPLADWLASPATEFVFHDADYDVRLLHREFGLRVARLFDTRVAAQFLNLPSIGLAGLLATRFGVATDKKWQRADWSARPLTGEMVAYAATDTRYLPQLRDALRAELIAAGRLSWVEEECQLARVAEWPPSPPPEAGFVRLRGARELDRRELAVLRELFAWRERTAERLDRALFRILGNETLLVLAQQRPGTQDALEQIRGVGRENAQRRGNEILEAIRRGLAVPDADLPRFERRPRHRADPIVEVRLDRLRHWRVGLAARIGLPSGLLAPNATLEAVARRFPGNVTELEAISGVRRWQASEFGAELLAAMVDPSG